MAQHNRNSPHLSSHLNGSTPSSPSMAGAQQQGGPSRQPVSYPSPTSYPSPSIPQAQYNYPPPNNQQVSEPYRASPTGSNSSLSLPSMRSLDPLQQQQQHMGSSLPPPVAQMGAGQYYHNQGQTLPHPQYQHANVTSDPTGQNMRYPLPATDPRVMSGGRHKKEIKRRTKTGCLTCRKRRIKCDEQHPACRNCQKSKRECLGYDPIFKQTPGPAPIQPAPSSGPSMGPTAATANPYGHQPQMLGGYAPVSMGYEASLSAGVSSPGSASNQFDYTSAIDPALEASAPPAPGMLGSHYGGQPGMHAHHLASMSRDMNSASPYSSSTSDTPHLRGGALFSHSPSDQFSEDFAYTSLAGKRTVETLLDMGGERPPPPATVPDAAHTPEEMSRIYFSLYAPGLDSFLETKWFAHKGRDKLLGDKSLADQFRGMLESFQKFNTADPADIAVTQSAEERGIWALATMVRSSDQNSASSSLVPPIDDPSEAAHRLDVFEALLTGRIAGQNPLTQPVPGSTDHHRLRELEFWHTMGNFVNLEYENPSHTSKIDEVLSNLRNLLDGRENRDVLYSIAVVRALGQRVSEYTETDQPLHLDENDQKSKMTVAKKFIEDEGAGAGTTNTIRRMCQLSARSWTAEASAPAK